MELENIEVGEEVSEEFFHGRGIDIAEQLLGKLLVNEKEGAAGIIVETEAYIGRKDPSCHFAKSGEARKKIFRKGAGTVYVYIIHGHNCMNFISEYRGDPEGILVRAIEPVKEKEKMEEFRNGRGGTDLASGPGKLTEAMGISKEEHNGQKLEESPLSLYDTDLDPGAERSARIGINKAEEWPARFFVKDNPHVSKPKKDADFSFEFGKIYRQLADSQ